MSILICIVGVKNVINLDICLHNLIILIFIIDSCEWQIEINFQKNCHYWSILIFHPESFPSYIVNKKTSLTYKISLMVERNGEFESLLLTKNNK